MTPTSPRIRLDGQPCAKPGRKPRFSKHKFILRLYPWQSVALALAARHNGDDMSEYVRRALSEKLERDGYGKPAIDIE